MIHRFFSAFALSAEVGFSKPDQRIFEYALQQANCQPKNAVMVGDRLDNDIYPANIIGMTTVRVLQGVAKYQNPLNEMGL
jgi:haloacid dehalogenase superfamily, subfamily IA, variant 1 with third motif having Dx(3-4)D or Dx(3-4)E